MKKAKKAVALILTMLLLTGTAALAEQEPAEENGSITVSLRIEGLTETMYYNKSIEIEAEPTVIALLASLEGAEGAPDIAMTESAMGVYVSAIDGLTEFSHGAMSGWSFRVNGLSPTFGMDMCILDDEADVVVFYGDPFGVGMQYPIPDVDRLLSDGIIRFTSIDATYDENWEEHLNENPIEGATVTFEGAVYTTDANGEISIPDTAGMAGFHDVKIERFDEETGVPTVLRLAPDHAEYVPFADTPDGSWYDDAVKFCVGEGYFVGTNAAQNLFEPLNAMSLTQLVTVLARIGGIDPALTTGEQWYKAPLEWALENGVLPETEEITHVLESGMSLSGAVAGMTVTRERFITMFYLTAGLTGIFDMTLRADITGATDYDEIGGDAADAVSWAVASGIIRGTGTDALTIDPALEVNRAMVCRMLLNYYL